MIPANSAIYLETSAVNFLENKLTFADALATRIHHELRGTRFYISPVTIWEILLTENEGRRETLILFLQNLAHHELLNSPSEFIINYIKAGSPKVEKKYKFHSHLPLAATWSDICQNTSKTFIFDKNELQKNTQRIRKGFNSASKLIRDLGIIGPKVNSKVASQMGFEGILKQMKSIDYKKMTDRNRKQFKISILLILIILCYGIDFDSSAVEKFWAKRGIRRTNERFRYLLLKHEKLIYSGPFAVLSEMVLTQLEKGGKPTRGIFWDALHSIYTIYTNLFFTADKHFKKMRENNSHRIYRRIVFLPDTDLIKI